MAVFMDPMTELTALMLVLVIAVPSIIMLCLVLEECPLKTKDPVEDIPILCGPSASECCGPADSSIFCFFIIILVLFGFGITSSIWFMVWRGAVMANPDGAGFSEAAASLALIQSSPKDLVSFGDQKAFAHALSQREHGLWGGMEAQAISGRHFRNPFMSTKQSAEATMMLQQTQVELAPALPENAAGHRSHSLAKIALAKRDGDAMHIGPGPKDSRQQSDFREDSNRSS